MISYGVNYVGKFDEIGVGCPSSGQTATDEDALGSASTVEDWRSLGVGGKVDFCWLLAWCALTTTSVRSGITTANANNGADAGSTWSVGLGYAGRSVGR